MDEDKFETQADSLYEMRKTSIHVYDGDMIERLKELEEENERLKEYHDKYLLTLRELQATKEQRDIFKSQLK